MQKELKNSLSRDTFSPIILCSRREYSRNRELIERLIYGARSTAGVSSNTNSICPTLLDPHLVQLHRATPSVGYGTVRAPSPPPLRGNEISSDDSADSPSN